MGRRSNRVWVQRLGRWLLAPDVAEKTRLQALFGRHRRFNLLRRREFNRLSRRLP